KGSSTSRDPTVTTITPTVANAASASTRSSSAVGIRRRKPGSPRANRAASPSRSSMRFVLGALVAVVVAFAIGPANAQTPPLKLKLGVIPSDFAGQAYYAQELGIFK